MALLERGGQAGDAEQEAVPWGPGLQEGVQPMAAAPREGTVPVWL